MDPNGLKDFNRGKTLGRAGEEGVAWALEINHPLLRSDTDTYKAHLHVLPHEMDRTGTIST